MPQAIYNVLSVVTSFTKSFTKSVTKRKSFELYFCYCITFVLCFEKQVFNVLNSRGNQGILLFTLV